jgi:hypothetical protein
MKFKESLFVEKSISARKLNNSGNTSGNNSGNNSRNVPFNLMRSQQKNEFEKFQKQFLQMNSSFVDTDVAANHQAEK